MFRYYTNMVSHAGKSFARGSFMFGLLLIGFGFLVFVLRDLFAFLAAGLFFLAGLGCISTAIKVYLTQRHINKMTQDDGEGYRKNVKIHIE